uniref:Uncharacterized protein n=1 Tax=candidate division WWE3 bacterium TaxID=2053526 RepID=A0A7C4TKM2_UNCKA
MGGLIVELSCPEHGLERFTVKVIRRFNISPEEIIPKFRTKPEYDLSGIIVGREVNTKEVQKYLENYLREKGIWERVLSIKLV